MVSRRQKTGKALLRPLARPKVQDLRVKAILLGRENMSEREIEQTNFRLHRHGNVPEMQQLQTDW